ncbi:unnamed protein product [Peronospora belbahrii]|uniref:Uncharacterized protein n=1 Tax=Peronospora belbahrii TaxID=622444 RepID=A0AAU9KXB5_9STRA|nr:unnamed protein product [Peronospora belbahrii]
MDDEDKDSAARDSTPAAPPTPIAFSNNIVIYFEGSQESISGMSTGSGDVVNALSKHDPTNYSKGTSSEKSDGWTKATREEIAELQDDNV